MRALSSRRMMYSNWMRVGVNVTAVRVPAAASPTLASFATLLAACEPESTGTFRSPTGTDGISTPRAIVADREKTRESGLRWLSCVVPGAGVTASTRCSTPRSARALGATSSQGISAPESPRCR